MQNTRYNSSGYNSSGYNSNSSNSDTTHFAVEYVIKSREKLGVSNELEPDSDELLQAMTNYIGKTEADDTQPTNRLFGKLWVGDVIVIEDDTNLDDKGKRKNNNGVYMWNGNKVIALYKGLDSAGGIPPEIEISIVNRLDATSWTDSIIGFKCVWYADDIRKMIINKLENLGPQEDLSIKFEYTEIGVAMYFYAYLSETSKEDLIKALNENLVLFQMDKQLNIKMIVSNIRHPIVHVPNIKDKYKIIRDINTNENVLYDLNVKLGGVPLTFHDCFSGDGPDEHVKFLDKVNENNYIFISKTNITVWPIVQFEAFMKTKCAKTVKVCSGEEFFYLNLCNGNFYINKAQFEEAKKTKKVFFLEANNCDTTYPLANIVKYVKCIINEDEQNQEVVSECSSQSKGGSLSKIHILGRNRNIIKQGRTLYITYNKQLIKLSEAKAIEKKQKQAALKLSEAKAKEKKKQQALKLSEHKEKKQKQAASVRR